MKQQDVTCYNKCIRDANFSTKLLNELYKLGKNREFSTHYFDAKLLAVAAMKHLMTIRESLYAILRLIDSNPSKSRKILRSLINIESLPIVIEAVAKTVFPDVNIQYEFKFYNALNMISIPVAFIRTLIWKLLLYSRRTHFGRYHGIGKLNIKLSVKQKIRQDPFDVFLYVEVTDNCPPMQLQELLSLENEMKSMYFNLSNIAYIDLVNGHGDHCWNNVFLMGSLLMKEIGGIFGIINHYGGNGEITDIDSMTKSIYFQFSLLWDTRDKIGYHSLFYHKIINSGIRNINNDNLKFNVKYLTICKEKIMT